jgi:predicted dehydrogenase
MHHAEQFLANDRFELVAVSDQDPRRLAEAARKLGEPVADTDTAALAASVRPDIFCFCTPPHVRLNLIEAGIRSGARLIAFEKPVALSSAESMKIRTMLEKSGIKAVVSHQHRYGAHYRKVKETITAGGLGRVHTVYGTATGWMMHMLSHLIDYMRWFNGEAEAQWVMGQAAGRGKLNDLHPSPDYVAGFIHFANGVHGVVECGAGAPDVPEVDYWWRKCRIGAQGDRGFAEVLTGGGWRALTETGFVSGPGGMDYAKDMPPYIQDMAAWLDDDRKVHPCNFENAYQGNEILLALCRSAARGGQVALPLTDPEDEIEMLRKSVPASPILFSLPENAKEYKT